MDSSLSIPISDATISNWQRLHVNMEGRLAKRANKSQSKRRVLAASYLDSSVGMSLLQLAQQQEGRIEDIMYSLCRMALRQTGLMGKPHVEAALADFEQRKAINLMMQEVSWDGDNDWLGFVYQSLLAEGERNQKGLYYTPQKTVHAMLDGLYVTRDKRFLDPCCGSGAFLLGVKAEDPSSLFGIDIDPIAVMIARTNLLLKYREHVFFPQIYCMDFLDNSMFSLFGEQSLPSCYDYIYTNPPWGGDKSQRYDYPQVKSKERASMFLCQSIHQLTQTGHLCFLLPTSLLKVQQHADIRCFLLTHTSIDTIGLFTRRFDGVFTDFFSLKVRPVKTNRQDYTVMTEERRQSVSFTYSPHNSDIPVEPLCQTAKGILQKMEQKRHDDLTHSLWALGIVTGNNKEKLSRHPSVGMEPIYAGKQVNPFVFHTETDYVRFSREDFQQCAKEELYRAPEKLVYRFIATRPVVAYDDKQRLCLNSANIVIPNIDSCSVKSVAALLNSSLYAYYYKSICSDLKVLKSNLSRLPFPRLSAEEDATLAQITDLALAGEAEEGIMHKLDNVVYTIFGLDEQEKQYIQQTIQTWRN